MSKKIKELQLNDLRNTFKDVRDFVLLEPLKLDSTTDYNMRKTLRDKKIRVRMVKNTLVKKVLDENGVKIDPGSGATLLCWGANSVKELSSAVDEFLKGLTKDPKAPKRLKEKMAVADGEQTTLEAATKMPTRLEAIGGVVAALLGPGSAIASALTAPAGDLAGILKAIEEKGGPAAGEEPSAPAAAGAAEPPPVAG